MAVTIQAGPGRSAFEEWKRHKGLPDATLDDFFNDLSGQDGDVPPGRRIDTGGLATGGGTLAANITIDVPAANAVEAKAGMDGAKALTPLSMATAFFRDVASQVFSGGIVAEEEDLGLSSATGNITPTPASRPYQKITNDVAFTINGAALAAGRAGSLHIKITNALTAGAVTLAGFLKADGDPISTTDGESFFLFIEFDDTGATATVKARQ